MASEKKLPSNVSGDISHFDSSKLKHAETQEKNPLPSKEAVAQEKKEQEHRKSIEGFSASKLQHVETKEKNPLPDKDAVAAEKQHQDFVHGIEGFQKEELHHTEPAVKTAKISEMVSQEKTIQNIEQFDKSNLKHAKTEEKNPLPDKDTIEQEKRLSKGSS